MSVRRPFLKTGNTLATLNLSGTTPVAKDALNIVSKGFDITVFKSISERGTNIEICFVQIKIKVLLTNTFYMYYPVVPQMKKLLLVYTAICTFVILRIL